LKIIGLIWTDKTIEKLVQKHNLQQEEIHELLGSNPKFHFVEKGFYPNGLGTKFI